MATEKEKEIQKKYIQSQLLRHQLNAMMEQKTLVDERLHELAVSMDAIQKLDELKKGEEMWSGIGSGAFVRSDIKDTDSVLISVGAGVIARKSRNRASEILQERIDEMKKLNMQIMEEATNYARQVEQLESEIEFMAEDMQQKGKNKGKSGRS